jgi:hypothetical protein
MHFNNTLFAGTSLLTSGVDSIADKYVPLTTHAFEPTIS